MAIQGKKRFAHVSCSVMAIMAGVILLVCGLLLSSCRSSAPTKEQELSSTQTRSYSFPALHSVQEPQKPSPPKIPQYSSFVGTDTPLKEVVVAIIDSGIDWTIPSLASQMWQNPGEIPGNRIDDDRNGYIDDIHGWDFRDNDNSSLVGSPIHHHGTSVASIVAAQSCVSQTVSAVFEIRLMDVRFLNSQNSFYSGDWGRFAQAIDYAVDNGARIINLSIWANWRPPEGRGSVKEALQRAVDNGVIVVGITGNHSVSQVYYPARYPSVLAVSAVDRDGLGLASFSNYGPEVVLSAPGEDVASLVPGGDIQLRSGTSYAAAHISGVLARIFSYCPELSANEVVGLLCDTATDIYEEGYDAKTGYGLVNADAAVRAVMGSSP